LLWWSLNVHVGVIPLGVLGPEFGLSLRQSIAAGIVGTMLGAFCTASTGTLSPKLGLRQIASSRYSFGFYGAKLCSVLNVIIGGGFAVVNYVSLYHCFLSCCLLTCPGCRWPTPQCLLGL
jgi:purine-cytosine permease-like protein